MVSWIIALAGYFAVGLTLVFIGSAARLRRNELQNLEWHAHGQARWKLIAFSCAIGLGIVVLWPAMVVSAARTEAASKARFGLLDPHPDEPSAALDRWVSEVQSRFSSSLFSEDYREISSRLPWTDGEHFGSRLEQLGYVVTGFATGSEGEELAVAVPVLGIGLPFALTKLRGRAGSLPTPHRHAEGAISVDPLQNGLKFRLPPKPDDEVWHFSSSLDSWKRLAGRAGLALLRERTVIDAYVTLMS